MINAAIVGLGWWGKNIADAVQGKSQKLRFVHGVTQELDATRAYAQAQGFKLSATLDAALADPAVQAVVLATPHSLHADQVVQVARAGKAVFCEKPLSLTRVDAERAVAACKQARVPIGVGQNKRFWPSMSELRHVVASGALGRIMHVEGHYSNENTGRHFSSWRTDAAEAPAAGLTGSGIHVLDALVSYAGAARRVQAQVVSLQPQPDPLDTITVMFEFESAGQRISGTLAAIRSTPFYWRIHIFGEDGSAEALGETELVVRLSGKPPQRTTYEPVDTLLAEFDAFADTLEGRAPYPVSVADMIATVAAFEAIVESVNAMKR